MDHEGSDATLSTAEKLTRCERYRASMMHATRDYTRVFDDGQDAVQEAMLRVALCTQIDWARVEGLLITVTRRICIDMFRTRVRREWRDQTYVFSAICSADPIEAVLDRAEAEWAARRVEELIDLRDQRILRRLGEGHALKEIAEDEGLKYKTAHSLVTRARHKLVSALEEAM